MKTRILKLITLLLILVGTFSSCEEKEEPTKEIATCTFDNPLTDLLWLKARVDEITLLSQQGNPLRVAIYQCIYGNNETGFLEDAGNVKPFYNCSGEILCVMGGYAGETCPELNIVSKKLIWDVNDTTKGTTCNIDNPLTDLPWLNGYCENLNVMQDFSSVYIHLYKVIGTDEHIFRIGISYSDFEYSPFLYSEDWRDCSGNLIFGINSGMLPAPGLIENFMKDKEFVVELFHLLKQ